MRGPDGREGLQCLAAVLVSDGERVVVLSHNTLAGEQVDVADVLTFRDGKLARFQTTSDTALLERVSGTA